MIKDIESKQDIKLLVNTFYKKVSEDLEIGPFFNDVAKINWDMHLPKMYNFWEDILFGTSNYRANTFIAHQKIHQQQAFQSKHFDQWLKLFNETVDELFKGEKANLAKVRGLSIATVLRSKLK